MSKKPVAYVAYCADHLKDEIVETAKVCSTKSAALACIEKWANGFSGDNCTFRLFELGKELPILETVEEAPQPPKTKRRFR